MTAVSWLKEKIKETYDKEGKLSLGYVLNLVSQAKAMEKEQIVKAYSTGYVCEEQHRGFESPENVGNRYYNANYGSNTEV